MKKHIAELTFEELIDLGPAISQATRDNDQIKLMEKHEREKCLAFERGVIANIRRSVSDRPEVVKNKKSKFNSSNPQMGK